MKKYNYRWYIFYMKYVPVVLLGLPFFHKNGEKEHITKEVWIHVGGVFDIHKKLY